MVKFAGAILAAMVASGLGGGAAGAAESLDAAKRQAAISQLTTALREQYVFPEVGETAAAAVETNLRAGAYDGLVDPVSFAARLSADLLAVAQDKHLQVWAPGTPPPPGFPPPPVSAYGIVRADKLRGGVGYIEVSSFPPPYISKPAMDRVMKALAGSKALVIDTRRSGGGDPAAVAYLISFLTPKGRVAHVNDMVVRQPGTTAFTRQVFNTSAVPVSFAGRPIYILTSGDTFSGAEEFSYDAQGLKAAVVVGEVTRGGANMSRGVPIGSTLTATIPFGRAENPVTKTNWDGAGVSPDIKVAAAEALTTALVRLGQGGTEDVAALSRQRVFTPRRTQMVGSDVRLRALLDGLAAGKPDYASMGPELVESTRKGESQAGELSKLGGLRSLTFRSVGAWGEDIYEAAFASEVRRIGVAVSEGGLILAWGFY